MADAHFPALYKFVFPAVVFAAALFAPVETRTAIQSALADAYIAVSSFVALTLALFYTLEHLFKFDTAAWLDKYPRWHVPVASFMGVLPGCGGAIIVIMQFVAGRLGFGSVVAVLTATMGDAAFLLLAREPQTAALVFSLCFAAGIVAGYVVERIHGQNFQCEKRETAEEFERHSEKPNVMGIASYAWLALMIPGIALGFGNALQIDTNAWFGALAPYDPTLFLAMTGAVLCLFLWAAAPNAGPGVVNLSGKMTYTKGWKIHLERVVIDTNFVTVWVVASFLLFELAVLWTGTDLKAFFHTWAIFVPVIAILFGFIPGCGPQILVTTFYLNGFIPFSALLGNAISNDGDALFPAIALAPRTALLATLYTAVPALVLAYGWYFVME